VAPTHAAARGILRHSGSDAVLVLLSAGHGALLLTVPSVLLVAIGMWWNANTVAHNFVHLPFFRVRALNRLYSAYLSLLLGVPQTLWRDRHLAHHAGRPLRARWSGQLAFESALVLALWATMAVVSTTTFLTLYVPGWLLGLGLCQLQGHYEHARGTTSHYSRVYNFLFFNDGYHVEHHTRPSAHWSELGRRRRAGSLESRWPPVLRWLDVFGLNGLERLVLRSKILQRFVVNAHERAFRKLGSELREVRTVTIVGGGLFPRTAIVLRRLFPDARLTILDSEAAHLELARSFLGDAVALKREVFDPGMAETVDLVVAPLAYVGDRRRLYDLPRARAVVVHDWVWSPRGRSVVVSWFLLKRLNLVRRSTPESVSHKLAS